MFQKENVDSKQSSLIITVDELQTYTDKFFKTTKPFVSNNCINIILHFFMSACVLFNKI